MKIDTNLRNIKLATKQKIITRSSKVPVGNEDVKARNDRQAVFQLVRDLVQAQFNRGDEE